ncbi:TonB-dependent receptor [Granulicella arctica]|uniref:TonB-dependent receptor n=1 Tax=Granulicella arctica TaxID=940613 RepID=UPI0021DFAA7A|nr:carboxypeptidase regulatory-like domain-containing protein [Granulicella arctica]
MSSSSNLSPTLQAQETTGAIVGAIKDASGAVIPHAHVHVDTASLPGGKTTDTDAKGNYHFANLPPGSYVITVSSKGFSELRREGLMLEVGHSPSVDLTLTVGSESTVVEVSAESPAIDVTTVTTLTNVTQDVINYVPRGRSYQSVIQFAPSARNEPLMGNTTTNGSGSVSPGNGSNGNSYGYSVAGGSDSENSYLVEGQETANLIGGYSHTNVPFDFIQEVQVKSSGIEAEHGGALGGVVNVIMQKGSPKFHGSAFIQFENQSLDAGPSPFSHYDATSAPTATNWQGAAGYSGLADAAYQSYQPIKPNHSDVFPGFTLGGPLAMLLARALPLSPKWNDKLFFFVGFNPELARYSERLNFGSANGGVIPFSQNTNTYYTTARIDARVTERVRVFASWLYQLQRANGENLPQADSKNGALNPVTGCFGAAATPCTGSFTDPSVYAHTLGYDAPNTTFNTGADITVTHNIVATTRFGYYFENYHDFGYPQGGVLYQFQNNGVGATDASGTNPLPASLSQGPGSVNAALDANFTGYNSNKAIQFDQDAAWYKSTKFGTHNFKFGYQLVRNSNYIFQGYNEPYVQVNVGQSASYVPGSPTGKANCAALQATTQAANPGTPPANIGCEGQYGYVTVYDFGTGGKATSYDHGLFAQDSWTVGHGVTLDVGVRLDKEFLPGEGQGAGAPPKPIDFSWGDKVAPRLGAAWDVFRDGRMKVFGSYGVFYDTMKLNLAISSFGGQYWQNCVYGLNTSSLTSIVPAYDSNHRYCSGPDATNQANFTGGTTPAGLTFIENLNNRAFPTTCATCSSSQEGVAPGLKPYRQHEAVAGVDYQLARNVAFEARYDRRRLDHVIEDSAIVNPEVGETFVVVNPGQGVNATFSGFCNFIYGTGSAGCVSSNGQTPPDTTIPAARSYDGLEFRLNKALSSHWSGLFSYTYSHFRGNYTGLTSSDIADGGSGGRNAPNNSRAFDEPYFSYNALGGSSSGLLPTDRPNTLKGYAYYQLGYLKRFTTDLGVFQTAYQGSPNTSYANVGQSFNAFPVDIFNRGVWADFSQNPTTGAITVGTPHTYRNPWYVQSDLNVTESYKLTEDRAVSFTATFSNVLNQHVVTSVNEQVDSSYFGNQFITPGGFTYSAGPAFYAAAERAYNVSTGLNSNNDLGGPETINSQYGKPLSYQLPRTIRLQARFNF